MDNMVGSLKPNSHKYKEEQKAAKKEEKQVSKVVSGSVKTKKKGAAGKMADVFISEDVSNVKNYIFMDVLVPAIKKAISDIVRDGIDMILYGESGRSKRSSSSSKVSYSTYYDSDRRDSRARTSNSGKVRFDFEDIVFETRKDAEDVREQMEELIEHYGTVSVADMYDMAGLTAPYTSNKYGWMNIRTAEPIRVRDGYILKLPRPMPIDS